MTKWWHSDCNVTDTISWRGHHDRVMQLNWLYFCGICQMMPLKVWPNTALGCNHQSICMPQLQPLCSAALVPNVLPRRDEGSGKPCAVIEALQYIGPHSGFEPGRPDSKSWAATTLHDHYTTTATIVFVYIPHPNAIRAWRCMQYTNTVASSTSQTHFIPTTLICGLNSPKNSFVSLIC